MTAAPTSKPTKPGPSDPRDTPAMRQYYTFKKQHPGHILLFRIGDFYETFDDDAVTISRALGLTLTQRQSGIPLAGVPHHQLEVYLKRLIGAGFRVAVCEQTQAPEEAKGVIERAVTRVLTPGTLVDEALLPDDRPNSIACVAFPEASGGLAALALAELSTGSLSVLACAPEQVADELARRGCTEVLYAQTGDGTVPPRLAGALAAIGCSGTSVGQWNFRPDEARSALLEQFGVSTLAGFGLGDDDPLVVPAGVLVRYLRQTQCPGEDHRGRPLAHLSPPRRQHISDHLVIDAASLRALEIERTIRVGGAPGNASDGSLLGVFTTASGRSLCRSSMGKRLLRDWLCRPCVDPQTIETRQRGVALLVEDRRLGTELGALLEPVQDVQRIGARVALGRCTPRDLVALGRSLAQIDALALALDQAPALSTLAQALGQVRSALSPLSQRIARTCVDEPPGHLREGGLIRDGIDAELDEARALGANAAGWLAQYQARLIEQFALPSLKVGFNKIFGYYIELPKAQASRAPAEFSRRQTLTGAERFITPELKDFEDKATHAQSRALARESALFEDLCADAGACLDAIARYGLCVAELDVLGCFADKACACGWTRPTLVPEPIIDVAGGRHPVLETLLGRDFVPNDLRLGPVGESGDDRASLALITGPNMGGKSTFIRQTALLVLLAHTGSFVPADSAVIGLCDRIFTRVGADDALFAGQSTFMVEMTETAGILHAVTPRSLVVLDEIGRGTSTLDGLSLAWAIAERFAGQGGRDQGIKGKPMPRRTGADGAEPLIPRSPGPLIPTPRTLFATHYHELTRLSELLAGRVRNLHVTAREWQDSIVFLHRIVPGSADQSYGLHVAKLAGIPPEVVARARELLTDLSVQHAGSAQTDLAQRAGRSRRIEDDQPGLFSTPQPHPALDALREVKLDELTPLAAFDVLRTLRTMVE